MKSGALAQEDERAVPQAFTENRAIGWFKHSIESHFKKMTSAFSAPTQAKVDEAGLLNALKTTFKGFRINVFPVFVGPFIRIFLNFPLPCSNIPYSLSKGVYRNVIPLE